MKLSVIIPAFNEEKRLPAVLMAILNELAPRFNDSFEIIVVDDGSTDGTADAVLSYAGKSGQIRLLSKKNNQGRGAAVREGVKIARGELILETDADGSVDAEAIPRFADFFESHPEIEVLTGSRNAPGTEILVRQPFLRRVLGQIFLYTSKILFGWSITDFVLGFKMFRRKAAEDIFSRQFENSFVAEAEVIPIALKRGWKIRELPVRWSDGRDSKVAAFRESIRSFISLCAIAKRYYF